MTRDLTELQANLAESLDRLKRMADLLERESACLAHRDAAGMEGIATEKLALMPELETLYLSRRNMLADPQAGGEPLALNDWLNRRGIEGEMLRELRVLGDEVLAASLACRRQNEINGAYAGLMRQHVQTCLEILAGPAAETTYGPDGAKRRATASARSFSV